MKLFLTLFLFPILAFSQEAGKIDNSYVISLPIVVVLAGVIIWSIRQEGAIKEGKVYSEGLKTQFDMYKADQEKLLLAYKEAQAKIIDQLFTKHDNLNSEVATRILDTNKLLSRMEGKLEVLISLSKKNVHTHSDEV